MSIGVQKCQRCYQDCYATMMSMFNTDIICMDCKKKEREHPRYKQAVDAECEQIKQGNYNFTGVGVPGDLKK